MNRSVKVSAVITNNFENHIAILRRIMPISIGLHNGLLALRNSTDFYFLILFAAPRCNYVTSSPYIKFRTEKKFSTATSRPISFLGFILKQDDRLCVHGDRRSSYLKQKEKRRLSSDITSHERFNYAGR